jgi:hypothetical protein
MLSGKKQLIAALLKRKQNLKHSECGKGMKGPEGHNG